MVKAVIITLDEVNAHNGSRLGASMNHQGGSALSCMKLLEPFRITAAFTEGLLCAGTVLTAFSINYVLWLWSYESPLSTDEGTWV